MKSMAKSSELLRTKFHLQMNKLGMTYTHSAVATSELTGTQHSTLVILGTQNPMCSLKVIADSPIAPNNEPDNIITTSDPKFHLRVRTLLSNSFTAASDCSSRGHADSSTQRNGKRSGGYEERRSCQHDRLAKLLYHGYDWRPSLWPIFRLPHSGRISRMGADPLSISQGHGHCCRTSILPFDGVSLPEIDPKERARGPAPAFAIRQRDHHPPLESGD